MGTLTPMAATSYFAEIALGFEFGTATSFSELDELIIQFLYDPRMGTGLNEFQVRPILGEIASDFF